MLVACGQDDDNGQSLVWQEVTTPTITASGTPSLTTPAVIDAPTAFTPVTLSPADIAHYQPNEMGRIPILMYHAFTTDTSQLNDWTRTPQSLRDDLEWLYARDFHVVTMASMINNEIEVPPGKHPVVLTFDDSSSGQLKLIPDGAGRMAPDPETAVGVLEAFFAEHPDFGRTAFFAVLPYKCFSFDGEQSTCEERLTWLDEHGYEIGNHTWGHQDLADVSDETLMKQVGKTKIWIDERVTGDGNLGNVLVLPFGNWPGYDSQIRMLHDGFVFDGQQIVLAGIVGVKGGPSPSPSSGAWTRWNISRFNADPETWSYWKDQIEGGAITLFTSDGNPGTVTIPDPIPEDVAPQFDPEWASSYGMRLIRYEPAPGPDTSAIASPPPTPPTRAVPTVAPRRRAARASRFRSRRVA
jgi:peptidoglycan/xylan/chitin deacetylase (PgdA/CDA1 family)